MAELADRLAMRYALPAGIIVGLLIYFLNLDRRLVPMLGDSTGFGMLAGYGAVIATLISTGLGFVAGSKAHNALVRVEHQRSWKAGVVPIAIVYALVALIIAVVSLQVASNAFIGLELARMQAVVIGGGVAGAVIHMLTRQSVLLNSASLFRLAVILLAGGIYFAAVRNDNAEWWRISFSYLGSWDSNAHRIFNVAFVSAGIMIGIWSAYFMRDLRTLIRHGYATAMSEPWIKWSLIYVGVAIAFVGLFKTRATPFTSFMHNFSAYTVGIAIAIVLLGLRWFIPKLSPEFMSFTWTLAAVLVAVLIMAGVGYINTVGLEVIGFALGVLWMQALGSNVYHIAIKLEPESYPT
jgi:hypothetical protein